ncbi:MAG: ATP synthase F0 subunit B, partial [Butyrivibrio sp.]|nr:ATP synthase F0 subunit B [Butyrivibrio sp.]
MLDIDIANIVYTVINLGILYFIFKKFLFKPVDQVLKAREEEAERGKQEAEEKIREAEALKKSYENQLAALEAGKQQEMQSAKERGLFAYEQIVKNAEKEAEKILEDAREDAFMENERKRTAFEAELTDMVLDA